MKVTIQNGSNHGLSRAIVEKALIDIPRAWEQRVSEVVICATTSETPVVRFHRKERALSVEGPCGTASPVDALTEMLIVLSLISERGDLPSHVTNTARAEHLGAANAVLTKVGLQSLAGATKRQAQCE